jgi:hypothetical protein
MPESCLSTYIATRSGWSNPVWYLFATISTWWSGWANTSARSRPLSEGFMDASVTGFTVTPGNGVTSGSGTSPEKATRARTGMPRSPASFSNARAYLTAAARDEGDDHRLWRAAELGWTTSR